MAKNQKEEDKSKNKEDKNKGRKLKQETTYTIYSIICFVLVIFLLLAPFNKAGVAGSFLYNLFHTLFGYGYIFLPLVLSLLGVSFLRAKEGPNIGMMHIISSVLFLLSSLGIINLAGTSNIGGLLGYATSYPFLKLFDPVVSILFLGAIQIISLLAIFDTRPSLVPIFTKIKNALADLISKKAIPLVEPTIVNNMTKAVTQEETDETYNEIPRITGMKKEPESSLEEDELGIKTKRFKSSGTSYTPPPLSLLEHDKGKPDVGDIKGNSNVIKRTLANFGILVEMDEITIGPTVTRYALKPAEGIKLSRIVGLQDNLALALATHPIRIEAPIPGKSLVGIEIPNKSKSTIGLATLLSDEKFQKASSPLLVALGRGISGKISFGNLAKMPHALIAGTTGSGKSVTIHAIINSLLYRNGPDDLKFIMVDPKRVELTMYNKIPHLLTPVITDAKKAILALKWAAKEMDKRYDILEGHGVQNIETYHESISGKKGDDTDQMPYIVIIIDELADIMQAYPRELESAIVRLAQMSRAVGIHLILSTQRPEVNVITGLIKANVPTRIALRVPTGIDSRTILDTVGAEKLLGQGDMLYATGDKPQPERLQSAFISGTEVKKVVKYLVDAYKDEVPNEINLTGNIDNDKSIFNSEMEDGDADDEIYEEARQIVIETGKGSTSYLQRRLRIGYSKAARILDALEAKGVVGPANGSKAREVLEKINPEDNIH